ncbi:MAG: hypothetical protein ABJB12_03355 [Pseudomonadota bacterium]
MDGAAPFGTAFELGNLVFRDVYGAAKDNECHEVPILVLLPAELALHSAGQRRVYPYSDSSFDAAKAAAHVAVGLFAAALLGLTKGDPGQRRIERLVQSARAATQHNVADELARETEALFRASAAFGARMLSEERPGEHALEGFARDAGERILRVTHLATCAQIARLHAAFETAQSTLTAGEREQLQVVVLGDHQARARSFGMQYFQRRFRELPGQDDRVTYGENISTEAEAIALVGTRRLDRRIARAFFGDEKRLQRDVLGDAAKACLDDRFAAPCVPSP